MDLTLIYPISCLLSIHHSTLADLWSCWKIPFCLVPTQLGPVGFTVSERSCIVCRCRPMPNA